MGEFRAQLHHVQLAMPVGGEDAAHRFYGDLVGMTEIAKPAALAARGGCWFRGGSLEIHLGVEPDFRPAAKAHPGVLLDSLDDLERLARNLAAAGVDLQWDDGFPGYRRFHTRDPHGNRLEFMTAD